MGVHSATEFDRIVERERALCDRSRDRLALVVFQPSRRADLTAIVDVLNERTRVSDVLGFLDSDRIAVLLPRTDSAGAPVFIEDVLPMLSARGVHCTHDIYYYPETTSIDRGDGGHADAESESSGSSRASTNGASANDASANGVSTDGDSTDRASKNGAPDDRAGTEGANGTEATPGVPDRRPASVLSRARATHARSADLAPHLLEPLPVWKRTLDVVVSGSLLLLLSPFFIVIALAIKLTSRGPVIYCQDRAGLGGAPFPFYKFRSMRVGADSERAGLEAANEQDGPVFKIRNDPRMTSIGRFLRRTSLDELPQLWSVFKGDMTLVGPRPPLLDEVEKYEPWQRQRLAVKGGLTCIWQVSGRSEVGFQDWVRMDVRYTRERSMRLDLSLLRRTAVAILSRRGAY